MGRRTETIDLLLKIVYPALKLARSDPETKEGQCTEKKAIMDAF